MSDFNLPDRPNDQLLVETAEAIALHNRLLEDIPAGAQHNREICPVCTDSASVDTANPTVPDPSQPPAGPDVSESKTSPTPEGGTTATMSDISKETHEALLKQAVADATATLEKALAEATTKNTELSSKVETLETEKAGLLTEQTRLNGELDKAQLDLKASQDKIGELETAAEKAKEEAALKELATERAKQVTNLGYFDEKYVQEKAESWAKLDAAGWEERLGDWAKLAPAKGEGEGDEASTKKTDSASAMSGTTEKLTETPSDEASETKKTRAGRAVLGLA